MQEKNRFYPLFVGVLVDNLNRITTITHFVFNYFIDVI